MPFPETDVGCHGKYKNEIAVPDLKSAGSGITEMVSFCFLAASTAS
jgi:hypothetical protein